MHSTPSHSSSMCPQALQNVSFGPCTLGGTQIRPEANERSLPGPPIHAAGSLSQTTSAPHPQATQPALASGTCNQLFIPRPCGLLVHMPCSQLLVSGHSNFSSPGYAASSPPPGQAAGILSPGYAGISSLGNAAGFSPPDHAASFSSPDHS